MLVRTTKRIAGFPPPGKVGQVDDEIARAAIERGDAEDMTSLSTRLRRTPEVPDLGQEIVTGEGTPPLHPAEESAETTATAVVSAGPSALSGDVPVTFTLPTGSTLEYAESDDDA